MNIEIKDGQALIAIAEKGNINNTLQSLQDNMDKLLSETSHSEYEDSLGYLDEQRMKDEMDMYGSDPMWWK